MPLNIDIHTDELYGRSASTTSPEGLAKRARSAFITHLDIAGYRWFSGVHRADRGLRNENEGLLRFETWRVSPLPNRQFIVDLEPDVWLAANRVAIDSI